MSKIYGSATGGFGMPKTLVLTDSNGNEFTGVVTGQKTVFTATKDDVKTGKIFASDEGIQTGEDTRTYRTTHATHLVLPNQDFSIPLAQYDKYDYTKFQAVISEFNTTEFDSLSVEKFVLYDSVYNVNSDDKVSDVTKNEDTKSVDLNITNNTDNTFIVHYNTYKEE